jgi:hypothetical protein
MFIKQLKIKINKFKKRQKHTKQSSEPIETKKHKAILRTHRDKNTQNNPQNP